MKQFLMRISFALLVTSTSVQIKSFDYVKEQYHRFMLGGQLYQVLQDKVTEQRCDLLKNDAIRVVLAEDAYQVPWWVSIMNNVSPYESLFSYAFNLYTVAQNVLNVVEERLKVKFPAIATTSLEVRGNMDFVLISRDETIPEEQIAQNIATIKNILKDYKKAVAASGISQEEIARMSTSIDIGLERIAKAEHRLTRIERWHRALKRNRFKTYIDRYCKQSL